MPAERTLSRSAVAAQILQFIETVSASAIVTDGAGIIRFVNDATARLLGFQPEEMIGRTIDMIIPDNLRGVHSSGMKRVAEGGHSNLLGKTVEVPARRKDGTEVPVEMTISVWRSDGSVMMGAIMRDVSERRQREHKLMHHASHDALTGLLNREHFLDLVDAEFAARRPMAIVLLDLDSFRDVNDTLGHDVGDALLKAVAIRLPTAIAGACSIARIGGDKFAFLLPESGDPLKATALADAIAAVFLRPFEFAGHIFQLGASIGYALSPAHGEDAEELLASADLALIEAKHEGGGGRVLYEPPMRSDTVARRLLQDDLLKALKAGELELFYQPQFRLSDRRIMGLEALLRWRHPRAGLRLPSVLLPAIENSTLALPVGNFVLEQACRQLAEWRRDGLADCRVAINLFAAQLKSGLLVSQVKDVLARYDLPPRCLELEITENTAIGMDDATLRRFTELRDMGVLIAFDDFGTGFASLQSLRRFPLTTLKIDRSFVRDVMASPQDAAILRAMVTLANELGLETIVEGIETLAQEALVENLGSHAGQGYLYAPPLPAADMRRLLEAEWRDRARPRPLVVGAE